MAAVTREILVFLASPGDCAGERDVVRAVADAVTQAVGTQLGVRVRVEGWETIAPDFGRPQAQINRLVDDCDVFIGLLGHRWGSPTGTHSSGFIEEFERAMQRRADTEVPHIALYFRNPATVMLADPGRELKKVLAFKRRLDNDHVLLYKTFDDEANLESLLWPLLSHLVVAFAVPVSVPETGDRSAGDTGGDPLLADALEADMDDVRRQIAATTDAVTQLVRGSQTQHRLDSARFLLIGLGLNDDGGSLPAHVANRLYRRRAGLMLSAMEHRVWLRSLLADVDGDESNANRVIPGWTVLRPQEADLIGFLDANDDRVVSGVFQTLLRLDSRPDALWGRDASEVGARADRWATALRRLGAAHVVETYLAKLATKDDLPLLSEILAAEDSPDVEELRGMLTGRASGLVTAVSSRSFQPDWKAALLAAEVPSLDDESVRVLATGPRTPTVLRVLAAREFQIRDLITDDVLKALIICPDLVDEIFTWAADGTSVTPARVERVVMQLDKDTPFRQDLQCRAQAATANTADLLARLDSGEGFLAWEALAWKQDDALLATAREILDTDAERLVAPLAENPAWRQPKDLLPFIRATSRLAALRILVRLDAVSEEDRGRLRTEVHRGAAHTREQCLLWLAEIATSEDLKMLISNRSEVYGKARTRLAEAILRVGGSDAARELLEGGEEDESVLAVRTLGQDPKTDDSELQDLLYSPLAEVRMAALEQIVNRSDDDELRALVDSYPRARGSYYYNVVCELDWLLLASGLRSEFSAPDQLATGNK